MKENLKDLAQPLMALENRTAILQRLGELLVSVKTKSYLFGLFHSTVREISDDRLGLLLERYDAELGLLRSTNPFPEFPQENQNELPCGSEDALTKFKSLIGG